MVKLIINDTPYDLWDSLNNLRLGDLRDLLKATRTDDQPGVPIKEVRGLIDLLAEKNLQLMDVTLNERQLHVFQALIYLLRRHAGEQRSFADCDDAAMFHIGIDLELNPGSEAEDEGERDAGPKAGSLLADDSAAPPVAGESTTQ